MTGLIVTVIAMIANIFLAIPALSLTLSAVVVMIMAGLILFDTSRIIHGGETNYIRATVGLYLNIFNLFIHLLQLIAVFTGFATDTGLSPLKPRPPRFSNSDYGNLVTHSNLPRGRAPPHVRALLHPDRD